MADLLPSQAAVLIAPVLADMLVFEDAETGEVCRTTIDALVGAGTIDLDELAAAVVERLIGVGGSAGQIWTRSGSADYAADWANPPGSIGDGTGAFPTGGTAGQVARKTSNLDHDYAWDADRVASNANATSLPAMTGGTWNTGAVVNGGVVLGPGSYVISGNTTITFNIWAMPGAVLAPNGGVNVAFGTGITIVAGDALLFGGAGTFSGLNNLLCRVQAGWARGSDLGAQLNNLFAWGGRRLHVPHRSEGWSLTTTVQCPHDGRFEISGDSVAPGYRSDGTRDASGHWIADSAVGWIRCALTGGRTRACFELVARYKAQSFFHSKFEYLSFYGMPNSTPGCLFWEAAGWDPEYGATHANYADVSCYLTRHLHVRADGYWSLAILYDVACEEKHTIHCEFRIVGHGDSAGTNAPARGCVIHAKSHRATEIVHTRGWNAAPRSHSAWWHSGGTFIYLGGDTAKGAAFGFFDDNWDFNVEVTYLYSNGLAVFLIFDMMPLPPPSPYHPDAHGHYGTTDLRFAIFGRAEGTCPVFAIHEGDFNKVLGIVLLFGSNRCRSTGGVAQPLVRGLKGNDRINNLFIHQTWGMDGSVLTENTGASDGCEIIYRAKSVTLSGSYPNGTVRTNAVNQF